MNPICPQKRSLLFNTLRRIIVVLLMEGSFFIYPRSLMLHHLVSLGLMQSEDSNVLCMPRMNSKPLIL